ncbi:MAG: GtrA family protein [Gammaproteobacteria bacterium]|jgi:putative flippase GtrA|nr:GtrA family protein [Gammaproteobacteria bacterium]MBT4860818.1 GtrA family protein [Gammaproteobacteria bacterium]MBT6702535.1 GtrA family protein [Gammaproteobacteria bacterium]MBT7046403.1 GtrA family protein [Gammaproteobacteria bacterium]
MLTQFIKFSIVGIFNTLIHYAVFYYLYSYLGLYHLLASATGFCFAVTNSYFVNKHWTFKGSDTKSRYLFIRFLIVNLISLTINLTGMLILVELFLINPLLAQLLMIIITLVVNFMGNKFWSFR